MKMRVRELRAALRDMPEGAEVVAFADEEDRTYTINAVLVDGDFHSNLVDEDIEEGDPYPRADAFIMQQHRLTDKVIISLLAHAGAADDEGDE